MPLTSWWRDNFSHFGRWAQSTGHLSPAQLCHKHRGGRQHHHHHYHHRRHPAGAAVEAGHHPYAIINNISHCQSLAHLFGCSISAQSAFALNAPPRRRPPRGPWGPVPGSFLSKSRQTPTTTATSTSTCAAAAAIYNNYHQMNKQTFVRSFPGRRQKPRHKRR